MECNENHLHLFLSLLYFAASSSSINTYPMAPLHTHQIHRRATLNRLHSILYFAATITLLHRHIAGISSAFTSSSLLLLLADFTLTFVWLLKQGFRWRPILRKEFPSLLPQVTRGHGLPALDVFVCTADPFKEPPASVASTALSAMAFDYPADQLSVYVSDDGGSELTLFAFMEAAKFARHWLPFCRENGVMERGPEAYFESGNGVGVAEKMKAMYEDFKERVERTVKTGYVDITLIESSEEKKMFMKWKKNFTRMDHPSIIQVLCESNKDKDITGHPVPNLIYISREKRQASPHHFKAGALNALLRVSEVMTNAPVLLTLDCDMHSNDPISPRRALCYLLDPELAPNLAFVQFPQRFRGLNAYDIYGGEIRWLVHLGGQGFDGLQGPNYAGSGCFFSRRAFYGPPQSVAASSNHESQVFNSLKSEFVIQNVHDAASCKYDHAKDWGSQIGFRYGSLAEDFNTGYKLHCEGWRSVFCDPERPAFLGHSPKSLYESLNQSRRWVLGLYETCFNRYCPLFYGSIKTSLLMGFCYMYYSSWGALFLPLTVYGLLPQLTLFYDKPLFPKASDPWFFLYAYLLIAAYGQDFIEFMELGGSNWRWWSDQRMWMIRGITSFPFGTLDFILNLIGILATQFSLTSKAEEEEEKKLYDRGIFSFGKSSPFFISLGTVSIINLISFVYGLTKVARTVQAVNEMFLQLLLSGFIVVNSSPVYKAMFIRKDAGKMPRNITYASIFLSFTFFYASKMIV